MKVISKKILASNNSIIAVIFVFLLCGIIVKAQQTTPQPTPPVKSAETVPPTPNTETPPIEDNEVIKVSSKLVVVPVSVIDSNGQPVMNLTPKDFLLEEEGKAQEIAQIANAEQVPLEIALLVDVSSSVNQLFEFEKAAAAKFLRDVMRPEDRATVFLIGEQALLIQPRDKAEKTAETVLNINPTRKYTAFFDTVTSAVEYLKNNAPENSRRVILTLSDGEDTYSKSQIDVERLADREMSQKINTLTSAQRAEIRTRYRNQGLDKSYAQILRDLQAADTVFYSINPSGALLKLNQASLRGQEGMAKFADETGGTAFLPLILPNNPKEPLQSSENIRKNEEALNRIFRQIAAELRAQYLLQYYTEASFPSGKYVKLKAGVVNKSSLRVKSRQGYFANSQ